MEISRYHPIVTFTFFLSVILITMLVMNPIILLISLVASISLIKKKKSLLFFIIPFILIIITNPFFSQIGETNIFYIGNIKVTLESLSYGISIAMMLVSVLIWFKSYNIIMTSDKFLYLFSRIIPSIALIISMGLKFVPSFIKQIKKISEVEKTLGIYSSKKMIVKIKNGFRTLLALILWSLENAIETADSMKARGYGLKKRTSFVIYKFNQHDLFVFMIITFFTTFLLISKFNHLLDFTYYPLSQLSFQKQNLFIYLITILLMFLPLFIEIKEKIRWHYLKSRI